MQIRPPCRLLAAPVACRLEHPATQILLLHLPQIEVLIVDDEVRTRELLSGFCRVQVIGSRQPSAARRCGDAAVQTVRHRYHRPPLPRADVRGADGRSSLECLGRRRYRDPPCRHGFALTTVREHDYDYLLKPFALASSKVVRRRSKTAFVEAENRELSRPVVSGERQGSGDLAWRLPSIDQRLALIEAA